MLDGFGSGLCESETDLLQFSLTFVVMLLNFDAFVDFVGGFLLSPCFEAKLTVDLLGLVAFGYETTCI